MAQSIEVLQKEARLPLPPIASTITESFHQRCDALLVNSQESYELAGENRAQAKGWLKELGEIFDQEISARHKLWKAALALKAYFTDPLEVDVSILDRKILAFDREQKQKEERERLAREAAAARKQEEDAAIAAAKLAEAGASKAEIRSVQREILTAPLPVEPVESYTRVATAATRQHWVARPIDGEEAVWTLICHMVKENRKDLLPMLEPAHLVSREGHPALNREATARKQYFSIPGWKAVDEGTVSGRGR